MSNTHLNFIDHVKTKKVIVNEPILACYQSK